LTQISDSIGGSITSVYDLFDRLTSEVGPNGTVNYTYDAAGRRSTMMVAGQQTVNYTYDDANHIIQISQGSTTCTIAYDTASRRSSVTMPNGVVVSYGYDATSRLNSLTYARNGNAIGNLTYAYDTAGRLVQMGGSLASTGLPQPIASAIYNAANQVTQWNGANLTYDANGNMSSDGINTYTWDARDRLASISGAFRRQIWRY
jgi:YD repeat-containing protein